MFMEIIYHKVHSTDGCAISGGKGVIIFPLLSVFEWTVRKDGGGLSGKKLNRNSSHTRLWGRFGENICSFAGSKISTCRTNCHLIHYDKLQECFKYVGAVIECISSNQSAVNVFFTLQLSKSSQQALDHYLPALLCMVVQEFFNTLNKSINSNSTFTVRIKGSQKS